MKAVNHFYLPSPRLGPKHLAPGCVSVRHQHSCHPVQPLAERSLFLNRRWEFPFPVAIRTVCLGLSEETRLFQLPTGSLTSPHSSSFSATTASGCETYLIIQYILCTGQLCTFSDVQSIAVTKCILITFTERPLELSEKRLSESTDRLAEALL